TNTKTPTNTPTVTFTFTPTNTPTNTFTATDTFTFTNTRTPTNTPTATFTFTSTATATDTFTATNTFTFTNTRTPTNTPTATFTFTPTNTHTATYTPTNTATNTATSTPTSTYTPTFTSTPTDTFTPTPGVNIAKKVSESVANSGDVVTYSLILNVVQSPASSVTVTDHLPANETFQGFLITPYGGTPSNNGNDLTWTWNPPQSLPVGPATITYQAKIADLLKGGTILTNSAELTYAGGPGPKNASVNVVIASTYEVKVSVYNESGELVKEIWVQEMSQQIKNFDLSSAAITQLGGKTYVEVGGQLLAAWDGTNQMGDPVDNGVYHLQVSSTDTYGVVTNVSQLVTVSRSIAKIQVNIYNGAGEVIRHLYSYADDPGNASLGNVSLSGSLLAPEAGTPTAGGNASVTIYFNGTQVVWDGRSDSGAIVTNGVYQAEVHWVDGQGGEQVVSKSVVVQRGSNPLADGKVYAAPNVLTNGTVQTTIQVQSPVAYTLTVRLYDIAGELTKPAQTGPGGSKYVILDVTGLASGFYYAAVDLVDPQGNLVQKQVIPILIKH
nr:hypothetical protein [bacterium]